ncbi:MAG: sensor histidine kinase [Acutalibacteraceae bacterium]
MATRSKKSAITKTVCFLLAVAFIFTGFLTGYNFIVNVSEKARTENGNRYAYDNAELYVTDYLQFGKDFKLTESDLFDREKEKFISTAIYSSVVFGDGSEKAYENYRKNMETAAKQDILSNLNHLSYYSLFEWYLNNCFSLTKIDDCTLKYHGSLFDYDEGFIDPDEAYEDDEEAVTHAVAEATTCIDPTVYPVVPSTVKETYYRDDDNGRYSEITTDMPSSVKKKLAKDCDAAVYICNAQCRGEYFDGWYALTVNAENAAKFRFDESEFGQYDSYSYFSHSAQQEKSELDEYKNMFYALFNKKTGEVFTNLPKKPDEKTVEDVFRSYSYNASYDFGSGEWQNGSFVTEQNLPVINFSFDNDAFCEALLSDYKMYLAFDETFGGGADAFSTISGSYNGFSTMANDAFTVAIICLLGFIACTVILVVTAGRNGVDSEVHMMKTDKIFTLLRIVINGGLIAGLVWFGIFFFVEGVEESFYGFFGKNQPGALLLSLIACIIAALFIDLLMYLSRHIKNRSLIKNLFIVWLIRKIAAPIKKYKAKRDAQPPVYRDIFDDIIRKAGLYLLLPNVIGILLILLLHDAAVLALPLLIALFGYDVYCVVYAFRYFYSLRKIFYALNEIRNGNYDVTVDTNGMNKAVRKYAEDVNALRDGLKIAVENAVREQRTKTELITNVSHDLKTPLTSIITYTDLLSRCNIEDETARGYIEVLGEKSARLKKLIEDLVEASKASTGSINIELIKVSLNELTRQLCGEYADEFESRNLKLVFDEKDDNVLILADSKLCYRVLDNLFCNIKKYAMPGTRVYVTVSKSTQSGDIVLRNVSENALNIPASELTARFVRGDESRSSEGNGLGLSIAKSLTELQGGTLDLDIAGDTFTAAVSFRLV